MKPLKILFVSRRFYPEMTGGGQISALYIAEALKKLSNEVYVCTFSDAEDKEENIQGVKIFRMKIPRLGAFPRLSNMDYMYHQMAKLSSKIIRKINPDIIHLLNFESVPYTASYLKKKFNKKIITTANGPQFGCFTGSGLDYKKETCIDCRAKKRYKCSIEKWGLVKGSLYYLYSLHYMPLLKKSYSSIDGFVAVSQAMVPLLRNMGVKKERISVIHNPLGNSKADTKKVAALKKRYSKKRVVFCASRLSEEKGVHFVINAMKNMENTVLLVAGWGSYEKKLKELAGSMDIEFLGRVPYEEMANYYTISHVFCHFPMFYDPLPRAVLEAIGFGLPVVAYPLAGIKDLVRDGYNGKLVYSRDPKEIAKGISEALENKKALSRNARVFSREFSHEKIAQRYMELYVK